jgi:hypothetical protein
MERRGLARLGLYEVATMMMNASVAIDAVGQLIDTISNDATFKQKFDALRHAEESARVAEANARAAKSEADTALRALARERDELEKLRAQVTAETAELDRKRTQARLLVEHLAA